MLAGFSFQLQGCPHLFAAILDIELIDDIQERSELIVLLIGAVHTAVDSNKPDIVLRECDLGIHSDFQIITTDAAHVLRNDRTDLSLFHQHHHTLPVGSLKVHT